MLCAGIIASLISDESTSLIVASLLAFTAAGVVGMVNGFLVIRVGMTPLLTTLAMFVAIVGVNNVVTQSRRINVDHDAISAIRELAYFWRSSVRHCASGRAHIPRISLHASH